MHLREELEARGFLHQYTHEEVFDLYQQGGKSFYRGADLSADSLTIGNFCSLMHVFHYMRRGNTCYLLVGGATSTIGNPSGKDNERPILAPEQLAHNQAGIHVQFKHLTTRCEAMLGEKFSFHIVNNYDRFKDISLLDFLRDVGKYITVNRMMNKDIVARRISDPDQSISFAEFSYMLIMGYDFYHLNKEYGVQLEVGGSDERDGIIAGLEITHKKTGNKVYGITNKLVLDSTGKKFGKSEGNAIWLDREKNSPYFVYQYFLNTTDTDIERFLKLFTFIPVEEISQIVKEHHTSPELRIGQKRLADYVTRLIFDDQSADQAVLVSEFMFGSDDKVSLLGSMSPDQLDAIAQEIGSHTLNADEMTEGSHTIVDLLVDSGLAPSRSEAKKLVQSGAVYLNETQIGAIDYVPAVDQRINQKILLIRKGKKDFRIIRK